MKHPVLARILSVFLAIVCVIMALAGFSGRGAAQEDYEQAQWQHEKLLERIQTYKELSEKLEGLTPYAQANAELVKREEQYERDASRHRSDVSAHTATGGGYKMGTDAIWEQKVELDAAERSYEDLVRQMDEAISQLASSEELAAQCSAMAVLCRGAAGVIGENPAITEPVEPTEPVPPSEPPPFELTEPRREDYPDGPEGEAAYISAAEQYIQAYDDYQLSLNDYALAMQDYYAALDQYALDMAEYYEAYALYQQYLITAEGWKEIRAEAENVLIGMGVSPPEGDDAEALFAMAAMFDALAADSDAIAATSVALASALQIEMETVQALISSIQNQLQNSLELMWYQMGELEGDAETLDAERQYLIETRAELEAEREKLDAQKADENKLNSTRLLLLGYEGIKTRHEAGEELAESAEAYAEENLVQIDKTYKGTLLRCLVCIVGGVIGLFSIPAGFEKLKSRFFILVPTLIALACALFSLYISDVLMLDTYYAAMPVIIFSLLFLIFALPRHKVVIRREI